MIFGIKFSYSHLPKLVLNMGSLKLMNPISAQSGSGEKEDAALPVKLLSLAYWNVEEKYWSGSCLTAPVKAYCLSYKDLYLKAPPSILMGGKPTMDCSLMDTTITVCFTARMNLPGGKAMWTGSKTFGVLPSGGFPNSTVVRLISSCYIWKRVNGVIIIAMMI